MFGKVWKSCVLRTVCCGLVLALAAALAPASKADTTRAVYIWNGKSMIASSTQTSAFFSFAAAPHGNSAKAVTQVYIASGLLSDFSDSTWVSEMTSFITTAHSHGIMVYYVCGDPTWAESSGESTGLSYASAVMSFNSAHSTTTFDGFQYDVEPYLLPGWPSTTLENGLLNLLWQAYNLKTSNDPNLAMSSTIPFWYDSSTYSYLDQSVMDLTDEVVVMDYTNSASNLWSYASSEIEYASTNGKAAWIAVDTNDEGSASSTTFYGLGYTDMESVLGSDYSTFDNYEGFAGYCIQDYTGWTPMGS